MSSPFVGEIRMGGWNFAPAGWAFCNGALMAISQNQALFSLIGTFYGGDGVTTFGLPNLLGRVPIHQGTLAGGGTYVIGQLAGVENVTLIGNQIPSHNHTVLCLNGAGSSASPSGNLWASTSNENLYINSATAPDAAMAPGTFAPAGGSLPHPNIMPYQAITFVISLFGIFPSQS